MNQSTVQIPSRSGIYATRKIPGSRARSLKLMDRVRISLVLTGFLLLCFGVFLQQNFDRGVGFINRPISKVRIENQWQHIREEEVSWLLAEFMGAGFFNFDMDGVKRILEQHPWVQHATIKKLWPESISLHITEEVAIAQWGHSQLLNQNGETFKPIGIESLNALPLLNGPEESQLRVMGQYQAISQLLLPSALRLTGLTLTLRGSWELVLNEELTVAAGRTDVFEKLQRFVEFYAGQPATRTVGYRSIDLRYDNGIAIKSVSDKMTGVAVR